MYPYQLWLESSLLYLFYLQEEALWSRQLALIKGAPWSVVIFSIGMYVVVYGLRNVGLTDYLTEVFQWTADHGLFMAAVRGWIDCSHPLFHHEQYADRYD